MNAAAKNSAQNGQQLKDRQRMPLAMPTDLPAVATRDVCGAMNSILADLFGLYLKIKHFHWHLSSPHFRVNHLMLDEQAEALFEMTDVAQDPQ